VLNSIEKDSLKEGLDVSPIINTKLTYESDVRWKIEGVWIDIRTGN
jgi:hypothetical protein